MFDFRLWLAAKALEFVKDYLMEEKNIKAGRKMLHDKIKSLVKDDDTDWDDVAGDFVIEFFSLDDH